MNRLKIVNRYTYMRKKKIFFSKFKGVKEKSFRLRLQTAGKQSFYFSYRYIGIPLINVL